MRGCDGRWNGPLGVGWVTSTVMPPYLPIWPASYATRREARATAQMLTALHAESRWRFRAVRLRIRVTVA